MSDTDESGRKEPTTRLEAALERIAAAVDARRPAGRLTPDVTMEVASRLDTLIRQIRSTLAAAEA